METVLLWLPTIFSFLTGTLIAASLFNIFQTVQTMASVCRLRKSQPILKRIRKEDVVQLFGGLVVTAILTFILFYPTPFVAHYMQTIMLVEIVYGLFLFNIAERSFKCCDLMYKRNTLH